MSRQYSTSHRLLRHLLLATTPFWGVVHAQDQAPQSPPDAAAADAQSPFGLEEIVVTAQRRPESLQRVPVSVTAISGDTLVNRVINDLTDVGTAAPSLQVGNDKTFSVRGIGTLAFSDTIDPSVAISLDGVNLGRPALGGTLFNDVAQIEVLNGPQGLLFGKNASAGLLNVVTVRPEIGATSGSFSAEFDSRDTPDGDAQGWITRATLNAPVTEDSALRVNLLYSDQEPITNLVGTEPAKHDTFGRQYGVRGKYLWQPSDELSVYVIGEYGEEHGIATYYDSTYRSLGAGSGNTAPLAANGIAAGPENFAWSADGDLYRDLKVMGLQSELAYTFANGLRLVELAAWKGYKQATALDSDYTNFDGASINRSRARYEQFTNELRLELPTMDKLEGQAGLYYFQSNIELTSLLAGNNYLPDFLLPNFPFCVGAAAQPGAPPPACSTSNSYFLGSDRDYELDTRSYAAFGQFTYEAIDELKLIAGGRVTHDELSIDLAQNYGAYFFPLGIRGTFDDSTDNTDFSWKLGAQYQVTPALMIYSFYGRGYKGPGFNDNASSAIAPLRVEPETNNALELGLKSNWFANRLTVNVSAFLQKFDDYQTQSFDQGSGSFIVQNAARLTSKGVEITALARPFAGFSLNGAATFLRSEFDDFPGAQCYPGQPLPSCAADGTFNAAGLTTPTAPKFAGTLEAAYERSIADAVVGFVSLNYYHRDAINFTVNRAPEAGIGAIDVLGANVGVSFRDALRVSIFCRNCSNEIYPLSILPEYGDSVMGIGTYLQRFGNNSVRTLGVQFSYSFEK